MQCWGNNYLGALGLEDFRTRGDYPGEMGDSLPPVNLGAGRTAVEISAGENFACAILDDGGVKVNNRTLDRSGSGSTVDKTTAGTVYRLGSTWYVIHHTYVDTGLL